MKKTLLIIGIAGCLAATSCTVDGYVSDQPADVVYTRPVAPGDGYVWIDGDWVYGGGGYHWHNGYWGRPRAGPVLDSRPLGPWRPRLPLEPGTLVTDPDHKGCLCHESLP